MLGLFQSRHHHSKRPQPRSTAIDASFFRIALPYPFPRYPCLLPPQIFRFIILNILSPLLFRFKFTTIITGIRPVIIIMVVNGSVSYFIAFFSGKFLGKKQMQCRRIKFIQPEKQFHHFRSIPSSSVVKCGQIKKIECECK